MTDLADKRRANRLMKDARTLALHLIDADVWAVPQIVLRTYPFVEWAADLTPKDYAPAEAARVLARFRSKFAELATVTEVD
jgi:hypothetical protein